MPSLGNGNLVGRYHAVGKRIAFAWMLTMGSTTTYGAGSYTFDLPVPRNTLVEANATGFVSFTGGSAGAVGRMTVGSSMNVYAPVAMGDVRMVSITGAGAVGVAWAPGNSIRVSGTYEAA